MRGTERMFLKNDTYVVFVHSLEVALHVTFPLVGFCITIQRGSCHRIRLEQEASLAAAWLW